MSQAPPAPDERPVLDCRGIPCPQPIMRCRDLLDHHECPSGLQVVVDNAAAKENVSRYLVTRGFAVTVGERDGLFFLDAAPAKGLARGGAATAQDAPSPAVQPQQPAQASQASYSTLVFLTGDLLGHGDDVLGGKLMLNFLTTLPEMGTDLWRIVMVNGAVRMSTPEHACFERLKVLEGKGVDILVCGACLEHFGLTAKRAVGQTTNMLDIVTSMQLAAKVMAP